MSPRLAACVVVAACLFVPSAPAAADSGDRIRITPLPRGTAPRKRTAPVAPPPPEVPPGSYVPPGRQAPPDQCPPRFRQPPPEYAPQYAPPTADDAHRKVKLVRAGVAIALLLLGFFKSRDRDHH